MRIDVDDPLQARPLPTDRGRVSMGCTTRSLTQSDSADSPSASTSCSSAEGRTPPEAAPPALDPIPRDGYIKHYEIIRELGEGGMGVVLLARDTKLGRLVAIKLLHGGGQAAPRLRAEAQATARARHDNIVVIYEVGELDGRPYMVLEYVEGRTLRHVISTGRSGDGRALPRGFVFDIMASVVRALAAAHKSGVVHRDLKPENIMLLDSGQVKVLDFGLAKLVDSEEPKRRAGTRAYMSPEQWSGGTVDERCDLWAAGLLFYELLAGAHPLAPLTKDRLETLSDPDTPMPRLSDVRPELAGISEVIDRCLRKNKEERFGSADELLAALEACFAGHGAVAMTGGERPFAGLAALQEADADRFFGRAPDVAALLGSLARQALVAVAAPSGAGKSSFIRAGVIPALKRSGEEWDVLVVRPGRAPLAALREALAMALAPAAVDGDFEAQPGLLGRHLRAHCRRQGPAHRMLVFVDQFEELYTLVPDEDERAAFLASLLGAADDASSPLRVILAIRSDFLDRVVEDRPFVSQVRAGLFFLPPVGREELREALTRPVEASGHRFESEAMVEEILDELERARSPLPLLQFSATELWEARDKEQKLLTRQSHERLGGVAGALATHADAVVARLSASDQSLCRAIFLRLVTPERTRAIVGLRELAELAEDAAAVEAVVRELCDTRLLLLDTDGEPGSAKVELVHESLIERWPTLARWLGENAEDALFLARLRAAASQWRASGEPSGLLWRDRAAEEARVFYERHRGDRAEARENLVGNAEERYLEAVLALSDRARRQRKRLLAGAFVFLGAVAVVVFFLAMRAGAQARRADEEAARVKEQNEALAFQALRGRNAMRMLAARKRQDDPTLVLALLREVEKEDIPKEWAELVSAALSQGVASASWVAPGAPQAPVYDAAMSPDGERIVVAMNDHVARILGVDALEERVVLRGHDAYLWTAAWSPDGKRIVTASGDKTARIWSADGEGEPLVLRGHESSLNAARMSPDGRRVVTAADDKTARVFSAVDGKELVVLRHVDMVNFAEFSPDGQRIVTAGKDGAARVWNADGIGAPLELRGHADTVVAAAFHPDGTSLATAGNDKTVRVWDASSGAERLVLRGHEDKVMSVAWSPDGKRIASASKDRTARIWNADGSGAPLVLRGHGHWVYTARFSPEGQRLVTASLDNTMRVWNLDEVLAPAVLRGHTETITSSVFSPDGKRMATTSLDGTTRIWNVDGTGERVVLREHGGPVWHVAWSPDGARIATASNDKTARIWNADGTGAPIVLRGHPDVVRSVAWCPRGDRIATASYDGMLRSWSDDGRLLATTTRFDTNQVHVFVSFDSSCKRVLVSDGRHGIGHVWNVGEGGELVALGEFHAPIRSAAWSPDGSRVVTVHIDHAVRIWDLDGAARLVFPESGPLTHAAFSPEGRRVAMVFDDGAVHVWKTDGAREPVVFGIPGNRLKEVAWSPDGTRLVTGSLDAMTRVWNADGSGVPFVLVGARTLTTDPFWSPDGKHIAVQSEETVARIFPDVRPFSGPEDPRLWRATSHCIPPATRVELLDITDADARAAEEACRRRVDEARAEKSVR
ncbi:protein kinase [Polyangium sp. 15x6]|uniref:nSTAND1 domain-containing NTPase n=1 Tax=Polyangium sp. 15x6 TaxID=3042687 RepID=UPI00249BEFA4|nr:protein kinase [Polyangium sp. 15x6]MDI3285856.1 protein kinase [Polyangium sp. 15x6]